MAKTHTLWADDEIEFLKPHILLLEGKGYKVKTVNNGTDAVEAFKNEPFDLVFLDENMPGLTGLETLSILKSINPTIPNVLVTKNEEEHLMEEAIGAKIDDYLIKPVNPKQILLTIKKFTENRRIVNEKTSMAYQQEFQNLGLLINDGLDFKGWVEAYKKLIYWELSLEKLEDESMHEILRAQKSEANIIFCKYIEKSYVNWMKNPEEGPTLSHQLFKKKVLPTLTEERPTFFFLIDNLRYDQWKQLNDIITDYFRLEEEDSYYSILPTATQYARNAIFSGLTPLEMEKRFPDLWQNDEAEGGKNLHEDKFLADQIKRLYRKDIKHSYTKVLTLEQGRDVVDNISNLMNNNLNVLVYNFVDMLSHARTDMAMIRELANDEAAYRSLTLSWFEHSPLLDALKWLSQKNVRVIITTDHGTIRVKKPSKVIGHKNTNTNLRYKQGKNLNYIAKDVFTIKNPHEAQLPLLHMSSNYIFAKEYNYFVYPNNYNQFVNYFIGTFQHGGLSMEEMIIPYASYITK
ncbi:response regulator receiver domain-containing protein [Sphingobacterium alimentarium]|uniref:Response regulator receiver domain-containing protein n=1 Tax=Sphingobacterium alimentarium TaxID=797292 RepID=A0A4R3VXZ4_9SPHI|nr:bifunctional response regulator/alkaline phosphatase family protein [Sphingobacterium alimentarium]TCV13632.1 response regulator receiver domain-containing protein [Sphingobacterium alimentarium]